MNSAVTIARPAPTARPGRLIRWEPWRHPNPSLLGHCTISFSGWVVHRIPVFRKADGSLSVGTPNAPEVDAEGRARTDDAGKRQYWPVVTFECADARARWQRSVLAALADAGIGGGAT